MARVAVSNQDRGSARASALPSRSLPPKAHRRSHRRRSVGAIAHLASLEIGWIPWSVGLIVGLSSLLGGVRQANGNDHPQAPSPGMTRPFVCALRWMRIASTGIRGPRPTPSQVRASRCQ